MLQGHDQKSGFLNGGANSTVLTVARSLNLFGHGKTCGCSGGNEGMTPINHPSYGFLQGTLQVHSSFPTYRTSKKIQCVFLFDSVVHQQRDSDSPGDWRFASFFFGVGRSIDSFSFRGTNRISSTLTDCFNPSPGPLSTFFVGSRHFLLPADSLTRKSLRFALMNLDVTGDIRHPARELGAERNLKVGKESGRPDMSNGEFGTRVSSKEIKAAAAPV